MHLKSSLLLYLRGLAMGAADVVPGVSGGTIAFITGIYDQLIDSLKSCNPMALKKLVRDGFQAFWQHINGTFLLLLFSGILTSVFTIARLVTWLLETSPIQVWSFFFGLVLVSAWHIGKQLTHISSAVVVPLAAGSLIAWTIAGTTPFAMTGDISLLTYFWAGSLAICAMILPGISGSFILLLLGLYGAVMTAVKELDLAVLAVLAAGCIVGLLLFSRVLSWLLHHVRTYTLAFLVGLMLGSLNKIWPWKETLTTRINSHGAEVPLLQLNVLPLEYSNITGEPSHLLSAITLMVLAFVIVLALEWAAAHDFFRSEDEVGK